MSQKTPYIITAPADLPVTVEQVKPACYIYADDESETELLTRFIKAAWLYAENFQQRTLLPTTYGLKIDYSFPSVIKLPKPPLVSVASITYVDQSGSVQTLHPDEYETDTYCTPGIIVPAYGKCWPAVRCKLNAITVTYTAGYSEVPADTQTGICLIVGHLYEHREATIETALSLIPLGIKDMLSRDRWSYYA